MTDSSSVDKAFDAALKQFGRVDVVVNNAGYGLAGEFESVSEEQARTQFEVSDAIATVDLLKLELTVSFIGELLRPAACDQEGP